MCVWGTRPKKGMRELFAFFLPFKMMVWIGVVASIVVVAVEMNLLSRVRVKLNLVDQSRRENDAEFDLRTSAWFSYASLIGVEPNQPRSTPNRILAGAWGLFGLIVISTYTANLTAFLTVKRMEQPIRSMDDLVAQTKIKYGIPKGGSTFAFFHDQQSEESKADTLLWKAQVITTNGPLASLLDKVLLKHHVRRQAYCSQTFVGHHMKIMLQVIQLCSVQWMGVQGMASTLDDPSWQSDGEM
ncbi:GRIA1 [Branchiostoma lanceolatum]|uniref:GRIA1 protein n=1 Tax=Branchiostoma lanceolatum TaxID=7740 RepID=A0A8J9VBN4_BRALA|nr:GRIA1 [Branchiostoma lanceolatum]